MRYTVEFFDRQWNVVRWLREYDPLSDTTTPRGEVIHTVRNGSVQQAEQEAKDWLTTFRAGNR